MGAPGSHMVLCRSSVKDLVATMEHKSDSWVLLGGPGEAGRA